MADNGNNNSAATIMVTVVIVLIIGLAFYFGFVRGNWGNRGGDGVNINLTVPTGSEGEGIAE